MTILEYYITVLEIIMERAPPHKNLWTIPCLDTHGEGHLQLARMLTTHTYKGNKTPLPVFSSEQSKDDRSTVTMNETITFHLYTGN